MLSGLFKRSSIHGWPIRLPQCQRTTMSNTTIPVNITDEERERQRLRNWRRYLYRRWPPADDQPQSHAHSASSDGSQERNPNGRNHFPVTTTLPMRPSLGPGARFPDGLRGRTRNRSPENSSPDEDERYQYGTNRSSSASREPRSSSSSGQSAPNWVGRQSDLDDRFFAYSGRQLARSDSAPASSRSTSNLALRSGSPSRGAQNAQSSSGNTNERQRRAPRA